MYVYIVPVVNGFVVGVEEFNHRSFVGRDGYYTREASYATPFATEAEARALASRLDNQFDNF